MSFFVICPNFIRFIFSSCWSKKLCLPGSRCLLEIPKNRCTANLRPVQIRDFISTFCDIAILKAFIEQHIVQLFSEMLLLCSDSLCLAVQCYIFMIKRFNTPVYISKATSELDTVVGRLRKKPIGKIQLLSPHKVGQYSFLSYRRHEMRCLNHPLEITSFRLTLNNK